MKYLKNETLRNDTGDNGIWNHRKTYQSGIKADFENTIKKCYNNSKRFLDSFNALNAVDFVISLFVNVPLINCDEFVSVFESELLFERISLKDVRFNYEIQLSHRQSLINFFCSLVGVAVKRNIIKKIHISQTVWFQQLIC